MRRVVTETFEVFYLPELMPTAYSRAVDALVAARADLWEMPMGDIGMVAEDIMYALGQALGDPRVGDFGEGDYPGVDGLSVEGWSFENAPSVAVDGNLTRQNAPGLPWVPGIEEVWLVPEGIYRMNRTEITVWSPNARGIEVQRKAMLEAVYAALAKAEQAGLAAVRYATSRAAVIADAEANELEFLHDGTPYAGS